MEYRLLSEADRDFLLTSSGDVFDYDVRPESVGEFLADPRHHIAVAIDVGKVVGFASAVHYVHPDKPSELWINEVGVADSHRRRGIAERLLRLLFDQAKALGCGEAWVLTEEDNVAANGLYSKLGGIPQKQVMYSFRLGDDKGCEGSHTL